MGERGAVTNQEQMPEECALPNEEAGGAAFARVPGAVSFQRRPGGPDSASGQNAQVKESLRDPLVSSWSISLRATWGGCGGGLMGNRPQVFGGTPASENEGEHEGKWSARRCGPRAEGVEQREIRCPVECACGLVATQRPGTEGTLSLCVRAEEGLARPDAGGEVVSDLPGPCPLTGPRTETAVPRGPAPSRRGRGAEDSGKGWERGPHSVMV